MNRPRITRVCVRDKQLNETYVVSTDDDDVAEIGRDVPGAWVETTDGRTTLWPWHCVLWMDELPERRMDDERSTT